MINPENKLLGLSDNWLTQAREKQRLKILSELDLLEPETVPVFEEATQTAAHVLDSPVCILGFIDHERHWFKSAVGLSKLGLMNPLARDRQLPRQASLCSQVVETQKLVLIADTKLNSDTANNLLVKDYGIRAYLGVPLIDGNGLCLGVLEIMDMVPRSFEMREIQFLELIARWCMSEFERNQLLKKSNSVPKQTTASTWALTSSHLGEQNLAQANPSANPLSTSQITLELLGQLTQELRTPLTSVLGMASVLGRSIYGPLTTKQKEYVDIIQHSGQYLLSLVNELSELGNLYESTKSLNLTTVDIEMLCQQAINNLEEAVNRREQKVRLSIEPGHRLWILDKAKVRQLLYHLIFSVSQVSATGSILRVHVSHKNERLNLSIGVSHPWLGDGLTQVNPYLYQLLSPIDSGQSDVGSYNNIYTLSQERISGTAVVVEASPEVSLVNSENSTTTSVTTDLCQPSSNSSHHSREYLGLLLSCHLAELHGGQIFIQGTPESGYRYILSLPYLATVEQNL